LVDRPAPARRCASSQVRQLKKEECPMEAERDAAGVMVIEITRAADGNHIRSADLKSLAQTLDTVAADAALRAVIVAGEGADFCCGRIGAKGLTAASDIRDDLNLILEVNQRLNGLEIPVIAAIEGRAFGFGCGFATQCDLTVAASDARFALPEMSHGLPPLIVLSYFGKFVPSKKAFELALTSREFGAEEARDLGIVNEVVTPGSALKRARELAASIAAMDADSVRLLRTFCRRMEGMTDDHMARYGVGTMALSLSARAARK
jgi:enoyl-CoA hydratase/carnithine racemase